MFKRNFYLIGYLIGITFLYSSFAPNENNSYWIPCSNGISNLFAEAGDIVECASPGSMTFSADVTNSVYDSVIVTFDMPAGYEYAGNIVGAIEISTSPITLRTPITSNEISFTFDIKGLCGANDGEVIDFDITYYLDKGLPAEELITCTFTSEELLVDDIAVSVAAFGTPGRNTEEKLDAVLFGTDTLTVTIVQEGDGVIDTVFYYVDLHPLMNLDKVIICATGDELIPVDTIGDRIYFGVGANAMMVDGTPGFERNEGIDLCEIWTITACPVTAPPLAIHGVVTSCEYFPADGICQDDFGSAFLDYDIYNPSIAHDINRSIPFDPICAAMNPYEQGYYLWNTGDAPAGKIQAYLTEFGGGTAFDLTSITYQVNSSGPILNFADNSTNTDASSLSKSRVSGCVTSAYPAQATDLYNRARLEFSNQLFMPGDTMFIKYMVYPRPCGCSSCDVTTRHGSDIADMDVWNLCDDKVQSGNVSSGVAWPYFDVAISSFMESPITNCQGDNSTLSTTLTNYNNTYLTNQGFSGSDDNERNDIYFSDEGVCTSCYFEITYDIPNGLDYVAGSAKWNDDDEDLWTPDYIDYTDNNGGVDILTLRWTGSPPAGFDPFNEASLVTIDYTPDCGVEIPDGGCGAVLYNATITKTIKWSQDDASCPTCKETIECSESLDVVIKCPGTMTMCSCDGFIQTEGFGERVSLYTSDPDNNGRPNPGSAYDESLLRRDRFLKGDTIEVKMGGVLSLNTGSISDVQYVYGEIVMPSDKFIPLGGVATIVDATDGMTYTCDVLTQSILPGNILLTDLSIPRLTSNGCTVPPTFEDGDSVSVVYYFSTTEEFTGETQQLNYRTNMYASESENGAQLSCSLPLDFRMTQVGLQSDFGYYRNFSSLSGCQSGTTYYRGYSRVGSRSVDWFPGEYIGFVEHINQFRANIPSGFVLNNFRFYLRKKNSSSANSLGSTATPFSGGGYNLQPNHVSLTIIGDQLIFDLPTFMNAQFGSTTLPDSDEGYSWSFQPYFLPTCDLVPAPIDTVFMETDHVTNPNLFCSSAYVDQGSVQGANFTGGAKIEVEAITSKIIVNQFPTCATIKVSNKGSAVANNVWLSFENESGDILFQSLELINGTDTTLVGGSVLNMFQLGNLAPGSGSQTLQICNIVNSCGPDFLNVFAGYDCQNYPTVIEEAKCFDMDSIEFVPVSGSLAMSAKYPFDDEILPELCDTVTHVVDINAAGPGFLSDVYLDIRLPLDVNFVPGSFEIAYPTLATPTTLPDESEWAPVIDAVLLNGNTYRLDVSGGNTTLSTAGLIGSAGSAFNLNVVNVRFKVTTGCGFASGSRIRYKANAKEGCGNPLTPVKRDISKKMKIFGAPDPFVSDITLEVDTLNACASESTPINISYQINGSMATTTEDSIRVILPPGILYVDGTYRSGTNPLPDPPNTKNEYGQQVMYWGISGLEPSKNADFSFDIRADDIGQECDNYEIVIQTFKSAAAFCSVTGENCDVKSISNEAASDIYIIKPEIAVTDASATGMIVGDDEMITFDLTIANNGVVETDPGQNIIVDIFGDVDNDGRFTPGTDTLLTFLTFGVALTPGESVLVTQSATIAAGYSCNLLAVIDISKNCSCSNSTSSRIKTAIDFKLPDLTELCSNESMLVGPPATMAYNYNWSALGTADISALSTTTASPTNFQYDNNSGTEILWNYGLRVDRAPGCYSFDTLAVKIFPETTGTLSTQICGPIVGCGTPGSGFSLSGPIYGSNYMWSILSGDTGATIDDNTIPDAYVSSGISQPTVFLLNYDDENGCPATFEQTVEIINCACTALGDTVWFDFNVDGIQDLSEPGIEGVTVFLYAANDLSTPLQSTATDASGYYVFQPLPQGNYVVQFDTLGHTSSYHQLIPTVQNIGNDTLDSDADPLTGYTSAYFIPNGVSNWTVDAGFYPAFDLALTKKINTTLSPGPYFPGDIVNYTIEVYNQGGYYGASDIGIIDYFDVSELSYINGTNGSILSSNGLATMITENGGGSFTIDTIAPLDTLIIDLQFSINSGFTGSSLVNYAEISSFSNQYGLADVDSEADSNSSNDAGGTPGSSEDNHIDDDGLDSNSDDILDEDDHDPAEVLIETVDLALYKKIDNSFKAQPVQVGDTVKFDIIIVNQGEIPVEDVTVIDYIPTGLIYSSANPLNITEGWDATPETTLGGILLPLEKDTVSIYLEVALSFNSADYINAAEITSALDTTTGRDVSIFDIDSSPGSNTAEESGTAPGSAGDNNIVSTGNGETGSQDDHDIADVYVTYPALTLAKSPMSTVATAANCYDVTYEIVVSNNGLAAGQYDLSDSHDFDDDIVISSISQTNNAVGNSDGPLPNTSTFELADDQVIAAGKIDRYYVSFSVCMDLENAASAGDETYTGCGQALGIGTPSAGEGMFNQATLSMTDFSGQYDAVDTACMDLPYLIITKNTSNFSELPDGSFDITYQILVENIGGALGTYDLKDVPQSDDDVNYNSASYSSSSGLGGMLTIPIPAGGWFLADDDTINGYTIDTFDIIVNVDLDLEGGSGDDTYTECGSGGGSGAAGDAVFNEAQLDQTNDGMPDLIDEACQDLPYLTISKSVSTLSARLPDSTYDITYEIIVTNIGGLADDYDLYDLPGFDDDITINSASFTSTTPFAGSLSSTVPAEGWLIADDHVINPLMADTFTVVVNVQYDLFDGNGDDIYSSCGSGGSGSGAPGEGLYNEALLDTDGDGNIDKQDEDCADLEIFDLAFTKTVDPSSIPLSGMFTDGDTITYYMTAYNQGTLEADSIIIRDIFPCGFDFVMTDNPGWTDSISFTGSQYYTDYVIDSLEANQSIVIPITFYIKTGAQISMDCMAGDDPYWNFGTIQSANYDTGNPGIDIDSDFGSGTTEEFGTIPNTSDDNNLSSTGNAETGSQDDHDPANIDIFDLALQKTLYDVANPYHIGDTVTYQICVTSQGNVPTDSINIIDYIASGYSYSTSSNALGWIFDGTNASIALDASDFSGGTLDFLEEVCVMIDLIVQDPMGDVGNHINEAEITSATTLVIDPMTMMMITSVVTSDNDGFFDNNQINDSGGEVNGDTDDTILGEFGDEDDADPANIETFDLALIKVLNPGTTLPLVPGDTVIFDIIVFNQGTLDAFDIQVSDYVPSGLVLADPLWNMTVDTARLISAIDSIAGGASDTITISFQVEPDFMDTILINNAEIEFATDTDGSLINTPDFDSNTGSEDGTSPDAEDNDISEINGDDDFDPAIIMIEQDFDLALVNELSESGPFVPGDTVTFTITVYNQGSLNATDVVITDYIPTGMANVDGDWGGVDTFYMGDISAHDSTSIEIDLLILSTFMDTLLTNNAEITSAGNALGYEDEDGSIAVVDGFSDDTTEMISNGDVDDEASGTPGITDNPSDIDDYDPEQIVVLQEFDLALVKVLPESGPFVPGDTLTFTITVYNQGTLNATDVVITEYVPTGMLNVDLDWGGVDTFNVGSISAQDSAVIDIDLKILPSFMDTLVTNNAEITSAQNALGYIDEDGAISTINGFTDDDSEISSDDDVDDEAEGTPGSIDNPLDVDDYDPTQFLVEQEFDLALLKILSEPGPFNPGDTLTYSMTVYNQGTLDATDVVISEYVPTGMTNIDLDWAGADTFYIGNVAAQDSVSIDIDLMILSSFMDTILINNAEIISADNALGYIDEDDALSIINGFSNDITEILTDGDIDDEALGTPGNSDNVTDADDYDLAIANVHQEFDLALVKKVSSSGPFFPGDTIAYEITVYNQGTLDATDIEVTEYVPTGMTLISAGWSGNTYAMGDISVSDSSKVIVELVIHSGFMDTLLTNNAEITAAENALGLIDEDGDIDMLDGSSNDTSELLTDNNINDEAPGTPGTIDDPADIDDYDPAQIFVQQEFDLALTLELLEYGPFVPGDTVTFLISVYNQGSLNATDVAVSDYLPTGMMNVDTDWLGVDTFFLGNINASDSAFIEIDLVILNSYQDTLLTNNAEIISANNALNYEDEDGSIAVLDGFSDDLSEIDTDGDLDDEAPNTPGTSDNPMDIDDYDPAQLTVDQEFDLALTKVVSEPGPYYAGDTITYTIEIFNQGTLDADSIEITDYVPTGMTNVDLDWTTNVYVVGVLMSGDSTSVDIDLMINEDFQGNLVTNNAEITKAVNALGYIDEDGAISMIDGSADDVSELLTDGDIDDEAPGTPGIADNGGEADDYDLAQHSVEQEFDLALTKVVSAPGPYYAGDTITYTIEIFNQGTLDADSIEITDYVPTGMTLVDLDWTTNVYEVGILVSGDSTTVDIDLMINEDFQGNLVTNNAEITKAVNALGYVDEDGAISMIDGSVDDVTELLTDNDIDDEASGTPGMADNGGEADDYDLAQHSVEQEFDLALTKVLAETGIFVPGDTLTFTISVYNQGTLDATDVVITEYVPTGMQNIDPDWGGVDTMNLGTLLTGDTVIVDIDLLILPSFMDTILTNNAEITGGENALGYIDEDGAISIIDGSPNDTTEVGTDGDIDDEADGTPGSMDNGGDADDYDPTQFLVEQEFDLALTKVLAETGPFVPGDTLTFTISVFNQGTLDATDVVITEYVPTGMQNIDPDWGGVDTMNLGTLLTGDTAIVYIDLLILPSFMDTILTNNAEITSADNSLGYEDEDGSLSTIDGSVDDDSEVDTDDDIDDEAEGAPGTMDNVSDVDDYDPTQFLVDQEFDLALTKVLAEAGPFVPGDTLTFTISVFNQGTLDATDVVITEYVPTGMQNIDPDWGGVDTMNLGTLLTGDTAIVDIDLLILPSFMDTILTNNAEITSSDNALGYEDEDGSLSTIDGSVDDDSEVDTDDDIDDEADGTPGTMDNGSDADDYDPTQFLVDQEFDLALTKVLAESGPFVPGDTLTFTISVYNQGTLDATDVVITEYVPTGMQNIDPDWGGVNMMNIGSVLTGDTVEVDIDLLILSDFMDTILTNNAEITGANNALGYEDEDGAISTIDGSVDDDSEVDTDDDIDDEADGTPGTMDNGSDADDYDPTQFLVDQEFDLALTKVLAESGPFVPGDTVTFTITVYNQGTLDATGVIVTDYVPSNMTNVDLDWSGNTYLIGDVAAGTSESVDIDLEISSSFMDSTLTNNAEITDASNALGYEDEDDPISDIDGSVDDESEVTTDGNIDDEADGTPGTMDNAGDVDDYDPTVIMVTQTFDLAIIKTLNTSTPTPIVPGGTVIFDIIVEIQGTLDAYNIQISDYVPEGLTLTDPLWGLTGDTARLITPIPFIGAYSSDTLSITFMVDSNFMEYSITNNIEIESAEDVNGDIAIDQDSNYGDQDGSMPDDLDDDTSETNGDDDYDPSVIAINHTFDLALIKTLNPATDSPIDPGDTVIFDIIVENQGTLDAYDINVNDYIPNGLELIDPQWIQIGNEAQLSPSIPFIGAGTRDTVTITFKVSDDFMEFSITNNAEINSAEDIFGNHLSDSDSNPNDQDGSIPDTDNDDLNETNGDDDYDPEVISINQIFDLALTKTINSSTPNPILIGGPVIYDITVYNQGTLDAYNVQVSDFVPTSLILNDPAWQMLSDTARLITPIPFIGAGDSLTVSIEFFIDQSYNGSSITNNAEIYSAQDVNGMFASDQDSSPGDQDGSTTDGNDNNTNETNGDDDYDPETICVVKFTCPGDVVESSCQSPSDVEASYNSWLSQFEASGCGHYGQLDVTSGSIPTSCGGSITVLWSLFDSATMNLVTTCSSSFTVISDTEAPMCPDNWDLTITPAMSMCLSEAYNNMADLYAQTGNSIADNCTASESLSMSHIDYLIPEDCQSPSATHFDGREIIRTYTFTDACGNESNLCEQRITYEFDECISLNSYGVIGINDNAELLVNSGCDLPTIDVMEEEEGICGYVEYMWLVSIEEDVNGNPIIPTSLNIGTTWILIPGANDATYNPGFVIQNTYFVRCARNFSCCIYGESNIVSVRIDASASCPVMAEPPILNENCDSTIVLTSPFDDFFSGEHMQYVTDQSINVDNKVGKEALLILDGKQEVIFRPGFEVEKQAGLEVYNTGCDNN